MLYTFVLRRWLKRVLLLSVLMMITGLINAQTPPKNENKQTSDKKEQPKTQRVTVIGTVLDSKEEPLPGVVVKVRGTTQAVATDVDGRFIIQIPKSDKDIFLDFSFVGMLPHSIKVVKPERKLIVHLKEDNVALSEVVVNGFFAQDKKTFTGTATTLQRDDLLKVSSTNVLKAITALTPNMKIVENNAAGSNPNVVPELIIRGANSLAISGEQGINNPLVILDGVEISMEELYDMEINEIESVTILEDASATVLYGERAANGVILVERVRAKDSKVRLRYSFTPTFAYADLSSMNLTNAEQKLELERLAGLYDTDDGSLDQAYAYKLENIRKGINTEWYKAPLRFAFSHSHSLTLTGMGQNLSYSAGLSFRDTYGIMKGDYRRNYGFNINFGYRLTDKLTISFTGSYGLGGSKSSPYGDYSTYSKMNPYEPIYDEYGEYIKEYYFDPFDPSGSEKKIENPLYNATLSSFSKNQSRNMKNSVMIRWDIVPQFYVTGQINYSSDYSQSDVYVSPDDSQYLSTVNPAEKGSYTISGTNNSAWDGKFTASYRKQFKDVGFSVNAGCSSISYKYSSDFSAQGIGFMKDNLNDIKFAMGYTKNGKPSGDENISTSVGFYGNTTIVVLKRYIIDGNLSYSGNSSNGANKRFGPFWSVGARWNIHEEKFFRKSWLNDLSLRWNMGSTGNAGFSAKQAVTRYQYDQDNDYYTGVGATPINMGNPLLKWQKTLKNTFAINTRMFQDRLSFNFSFYLDKTFDMLVPIDLPPSVGVSSVKVNMGELLNKGLSFSLSGRILQTKNWYLSSYINGSHNFDKITKISDALEKTNQGGDTGTKPKLLYKEGGSQYDIYAVRSAGIDPATGQEIFITKDGHYTLKYSEDDTVAVGNENPILKGNWGLTLAYKGFGLNLTSSYTFGGDIYNSTIADAVENIDPYFNVDVRAFTDRWKQPGDHTRFLGLGEKKELFRSERFVEKKNEFYLSNITFTYELPKSFLKKIKLERLVVGIAYDDVFRISSVKMERGTSYPYQRSLNLIFRPTF